MAKQGIRNWFKSGDPWIWMIGGANQFAVGDSAQIVFRNDDGPQMCEERLFPFLRQGHHLAGVDRNDRQRHGQVLREVMLPAQECFAAGFHGTGKLRLGRPPRGRFRAELLLLAALARTDLAAGRFQWRER